MHIVTWNVATKFPKDSEPLHQMLGLVPNSSSYVKVPDLYVIGLQEVNSQPQNMLWNAVFDDPWTQRIKEVLAEVGLVKVQTIRLQGLQTSIFIKRTHLIYIRDIEDLLTRRGLGGIWGNKGAISYRLGIYGCSLVFVNCHLTPHDHQVQERIEDYKQILTTQEFSLAETSNILFHDYVFWFGDLNFRLNGSKSSAQIMEYISNNSFAALLKDDQLKSVQQSGDAFSELREPPITFPPTYKLETGFDSYDLKRRPAWTDRILYQVNSNVYDNVTLKAEVSGYKSHIKYRVSDHRPVTAQFDIKVFRPTVEKMVEFLEPTQWRVSNSKKVFYKVCSTLETSAEDWIGIYKADFSSLDDYVAYAYIQQSTSAVPAANLLEQADEDEADPLTVERSILFSDSSILFEGSYVLIYFSREPRSVYGMSQEFRVHQEITPI